MPYWVWPLLLLMTIPLVLWWFVKSVERGERRRTEAMRQMAQQMGFEFDTSRASSALGRLHGFPLITRGDRIRVPNFMMGVSPQGTPVVVYDFYYRAGSSHRPTVLGTTVVHIVSRDLNLPQFAAWPETAIHRALQAVGQKDIDLPDKPDFSAAFWLRGEDEEAIRRLFSGEPAAALMNEVKRGSKICVEGGGTDLIVYHQFRPARPDALPQLIEEAERVYRGFMRGA